MATPQQIAELRIDIQELEDTEPYTDEFLSGMLDAYGENLTKIKIWTAKRNAVAALVDISEGGSSRKMSQLFDNYAKIVIDLESESETNPDAVLRSRTRRAVRV